MCMYVPVWKIHCHSYLYIYLHILICSLASLFITSFAMRIIIQAYSNAGKLSHLQNPQNMLCKLQKINILHLIKHKNLRSN